VQRLTGPVLTDGGVSLREISSGDIEILYRWRMHPSSRPMFRHTDTVPFESHQSMVHAYLDSESPDCWFIIEAAGFPVGTFALYNFSDDVRECEWGRFTVAPEARNQGYGRRALKLLMEYAHAIGVNRLICEVLEANAVAVRLYRDLGFVRIAAKEEGGRNFLTLAAALAGLPASATPANIRL
jgi:RimJ/RimL family protein N-acetyltransferase